MLNKDLADDVKALSLDATTSATSTASTLPLPDKKDTHSSISEHTDAISVEGLPFTGRQRVKKDLASMGTFSSGTSNFNMRLPLPASSHAISAPERDDSVKRTPRSNTASPREAIEVSRPRSNSRYRREVSFSLKLEGVEDVISPRVAIETARQRSQSANSRRIPPIDMVQIHSNSSDEEQPETTRSLFTPRYTPRDEDHVESALPPVLKVGEVKEVTDVNEIQLKAKEFRYTYAVEILDKPDELISPGQLKEVKMVLTELGNYQDSNFRLAELYYKENDFQKAERCMMIHFSVEHNRKNDKAQKLFGKINLQLAQIEPQTKVSHQNIARNHLNKAVKLNPTDSEALQLLGEIYYEKRDFVQSRQCFLDALDLRDGDIKNCLIFLGKINSVRQNLYEAEIIFAQVIDIDPAHIEASILLSNVYERKARDYEAQGRMVYGASEFVEKAKAEFEKAKKVLVAVLGQVPGNEVLLTNLQDLRYRWDDLLLEQAYERNGRNVWLTFKDLKIDNNLPLVRAILKAKEAEVFNRYGKKVNGLGDKGISPLHECIGSSNLVKLLVEDYKADINTPDDLKNTPIMVAAAAGHTKVVEYLLSRGADLKCTNKESDNIFHFIIKYGDPKNSLEIILLLVKHLREQDVERKLQNQENREDPATNLILDLLTKPNRNGQSFTQLAREANQEDLIELFQEVGALVLNERLLGIFKTAFRLNGKDTDYIAECETDTVISSHKHHRTFLQKYLPYFPNTAFSFTALFYPFNDTNQTTYFKILERIDQADRAIFDGESVFPVVMAATIMQEIFKIITDEIGFHCLDLGSAYDPTSVLGQIIHTNNKLTAQLNGKREEEVAQSVLVNEPFLTVIPQRVIASQGTLRDTFYLRIFNARMSQLISLVDKPASSANSYEADGLDLYNDVADFIRTNNGTRVNERLRSFSVAKCREFVSRLDLDIDGMVTKAMKNFKTADITEDLKDLEKLYQSLCFSEKAKMLYEVKDCLVAIHTRLGTVVPHNQRLETTNNLNAEYLRIASEGDRKTRKIPLAAMLKATFRKSDALLAKHLEENNLGILVLDSKKTVFENIAPVLKDAQTRLLKMSGSPYKRCLVLESCLAMPEKEKVERSHAMQSYTIIGKLWPLFSGLPTQPFKGWAAEINRMLCNEHPEKQLPYISRLVAQRAHTPEIGA
jgi:tetratricopeptide (TPR) repeat protein